MTPNKSIHTSKHQNSVQSYFTGRKRPFAEALSLLYSEPNLLHRNTVSLSDLSLKNDS